MRFFDHQGTMELPVEPQRISNMVAAVARLIDYTGGAVTSKTDNDLAFKIPPFIFAGRIRPLARLSKGHVSFESAGEEEVLLSFDVRTSKANIIASYVIMVLLVAVAVVAWKEGQTRDPLIVAVVIALGPLFALTLIQQSFSRFKRELKDACLLGALYGEDGKLLDSQ